MRKLRRSYYVLIMVVFLCFLLTACVGQDTTTAINSGDVLTQKEIHKDKIPITVLVKNAFAVDSFEKAAEIKFPDIDIIQVGNYSSEMGIDEYEARLKNHDLTDMVMTWPVNVGEEYLDGSLMDLSSLPMSGKYTNMALNDISQDGSLYYLPGPAQVRGILYNKTLFEENGWEVPKDYNGFIALCQTIEKTGMRSLQLGLGNAEVLDTAFVGYGYESCFSKPENAKKIADYNKGIGSFGDNFTPALNTFQDLIDKGILKKEDLNLHYQDREKMIFSRQCAMVEDSVLMCRMGEEKTGSTDEFALMPFFNPGVDNDWARLYPVCYIGANKKLEQTENRNKYDLVMDLLEYISTPEGQHALAGDTGAMYSSLKNTEPSDAPEITDLRPTLVQGRCAIFPTLKNAQNSLRRGLAGMVAGNLTADDVITMVDAENSKPPKIEDPKVVGTAAADFSMIETGNFITDTMREAAKSDFALFLDNGKDGKNNGKGICGRLYKGDITQTDINRILPDLRVGEKGELWKVTLTGANLLKTLEYSIPVDNNITGWFYYFSGLKMEFAPNAKPGQRIKSITDDKGNSIDPKKEYTVAVADDSIPREFIISWDKTNIPISDLLLKKIKEEKTIKPGDDHRFTLCVPK
ncbi:MAG: extracellular solute-binding protein [Clostridiales bacterium]